ncbi:serine/threonine protein kinase [Streptomyces sp. ISL-66]|uniref:protein kinase n=1 Tax=Streptomyces sp. ISL-66 TaxID=2819186 RepID=UPI001BE70B43|nr:protein kinase [Streptomyces sp. ISL-66]MBT2467660.1 serine/threonine protein kinase [Streptomyces sp. ISL-66]
MEDYAGRILAERYRLPLPPSDEYELIETRAFDTRSGQEVLIRQVPLPEVVDAELLDGARGGPAVAGGRRAPGELPAVRRAIEAAQAAASVPDHPRLDQVFDVFAEGGSLWIVSELVPARPLAALIAEEPLSPYRAAEVAADVLTALRVLHAHGWTHRNITVRTVLICEDGRVVLTGLAAGAAEDALCGYDPVPSPDGFGGPAVRSGGAEPGHAGPAGPVRSIDPAGLVRSIDPAGPVDPVHNPGAGAGAGGGGGSEYAPIVAPGYDTGPRYTDHIVPGSTGDAGERPDPKAAARAGAIASYRAGAQAAARITEQRKAGADPALGPAREPRPEGSNLPQGYSYPYGGPDGGASWHGATPRRRAALPAPPPRDGAEPQTPPVRPGPPEAQTSAVRPSLPEAQTPPVYPSLPEGQSPPVRPGLPAQLALPQGYRQADSPEGAPDPGRPLTPRPSRQSRPGDETYGYGYGNAAPTPAPPTPAPPPPPPGGGGGGWGSGPRSGLDAERARQTRMAVVGAVTERWSPEQAQAVHGPWQLAAPVGPATDLWGLGALLYRAVQGHAPYPEDSVGELVEMVCAEPPAFAEECGPLRPVVESLLRQDPTERPDFEELRGWLRSLVRSAPEPDANFAALLPIPEPDPARLPVVRRRGDLHGRHRSAEHPRKPLALGRALLLGVLVLLAGAVAYALFFMPRSADPQGDGGQKAAGMKPPSAQPKSPGASTGPSPKPNPSGASPSAPESKPAPQTNAPAPAGYTTQQDAEHFEITVPNGWDRRGMNESGQVRYTEGEFALTIVPGRDKVEGNPDPATYQKDKEPELAPYRSSTWSSVSDIKSTKVGNQLRVTGRYTWIDGNGRSVVARNYVVALGGSYHVVLVTGPQDQEGKVTEAFEQATASYRTGG